MAILPMRIKRVSTWPFADQMMGTSGLRRSVDTFKQKHYLANFIQSILNVSKRINQKVPDVLVVGGDGRYYLREAVQTILGVAAANGVSKVLVGKEGLLSTPAASTVIRRRDGGFKVKGAFILTASHNPGGPNGDFGIKYNNEVGAPVSDTFAAAVFEESKRIDHFLSLEEFPLVDIDSVGTRNFGCFTVEVMDGTEDYVDYMESIFDFASIRKLLGRGDFQMRIDSLHGVSGPYVDKIYADRLGLPQKYLYRTAILPDFGGLRPDPNLIHARDLVTAMGLSQDGTAANLTCSELQCVPHFGCSFDADADRYMIMGRRFFVTPSDSLAVFAANAGIIPFFRRRGALAAVARTMPTSRALDRVAAARNLKLFEVPTGWKYFSNLMESHHLKDRMECATLICGEESFGAGSSHLREKDGIWASLFWLSILASRNHLPCESLVGVQEIVESHWMTYGRNYYLRFDYEGVAVEAAQRVIDKVRLKRPSEVDGLQKGSIPCTSIDPFEYFDPLDGKVLHQQGYCTSFADESRFVIRLSGTSSSDATIRLYLESYMPASAVKGHIARGSLPSPLAMLKDLSNVALNATQIQEITGRIVPSVIT